MQETSPPQYIHLLNPDTEIERHAVTVLAEYLENHPRAAAVGSQLLELDGSWTGSAFSFPTLRGEFSRGARTAVLDRLLRVPPVSITASTHLEVEWATGASVMFRVDALRQVGLFDEGFFLYHEEIELMWRLRNAGWAIAFEPRSRVRHVGGGATGVHSRKTSGALELRKPRYWYRSRCRYFGLARGRTVATLAFFIWLIGHALWRVRRVTGLAPDAKPFDHQLRDHLVYAFPRKHDSAAAVMPFDRSPSTTPAWMEKGWL
jgi:GT2 family glycosyltransferase